MIGLTRRERALVLHDLLGLAIPDWLNPTRPELLALLPPRKEPNNRLAFLHLKEAGEHLAAEVEQLLQGLDDGAAQIDRWRRRIKDTLAPYPVFPAGRARTAASFTEVVKNIKEDAVKQRLEATAT